MLKWQKAIIVAVAAIDQAAKYFIRSNYFLHESRELTGFLSLTYVQNTGVAFGFFHGGVRSNLIFIFISIIVIIAIIINKNAFEEKGGKFAKLGIPLVLGGALGNLIDRALLGSVVDFIDFHFFPVFNVADSCITVGGIVLFASMIFSKKAAEKNVS